MSTKQRAMHVAKITRKVGDRVYEYHLVRRTYREGGKVKHETLANLSALPAHVIDQIARSLQGESFFAVSDGFRTVETLPHGHVRAVLGVMHKLGLDDLIASKPCRERDLVMGMVAQQVLQPASKLATVALWGQSTLATELGIEGATEDELYEALAWASKRQEHIEKKLARKHLEGGASVLYDMSNCRYYGTCCPLAAFGKDKDSRRSRRIVSFGLLTNREGLPIAIEVFPGNTGDPSTVADLVAKIRFRFGIDRVVLVGDRGMVTQARIDEIREWSHLGWISALRGPTIRRLVDGGALQLSLFDERNLAEITSPDFPGERLIACYNPLAADDEARTRTELLDCTEEALVALQAKLAKKQKKAKPDDQLGRLVGSILDRYKVARFFTFSCSQGAVAFQRNAEAIREAEELDGVYVVRTSEPSDRLSATDAVRTYKRMAEVEQSFRHLKSIDIQVQPVRLRLEEHVRGHFFLAMLALYVQTHMRQALAPMLYEDEEIADLRETRDPVEQAKPSDSAKQKRKTHLTADGLRVHSFATLMGELRAQARVTYQVGAGEDAPSFRQVPPPTPTQARAFDLLGV